MGHSLSLEHRKKISKSMKGKIRSEEHRRNLGKALKGKKLTPEHLKNLRKAFKKRVIRDRAKWKLNMSKAKIGHRVSLETREKIRRRKQGKKRPDVSGEKCHLWKGGITPINLKIRNGLKTKIWRRKVFERDKYTCQICKVLGGRLNAHHIKPFSQYPDLRFMVDNGITLCKNCHRLIHKEKLIFIK